LVANGRYKNSPGMMPGLFYTNHYTNADENPSQRVLHGAGRTAVHAKITISVAP
jgi:hypothetical protein